MHSSTPISFHLSRITYVFLGIVAGVFIGTTIRFVFAEVTWKAPPAGTIPPENNVEAPLNVSTNAQHKAGALSVNATQNPLPGFGLDVGGNAMIGEGLRIGGNATVTGKIHSAPTQDSDLGTTVVTKDYLLSKVPVSNNGVGFNPNAQWLAFDISGLDAQRKLGVWYTNDTGYPIMVTPRVKNTSTVATCAVGVTVRNAGDTTSSGVNVAGQAVNNSTGNCVASAEAIVMPNQQYKATASSFDALVLWAELR